MSKKFSDKLKKARELKNISADDLAEQLCVSRQTIYDWESGKSEPRKTKLYKLQEILNLGHDHHTDTFGVIDEKNDVKLIPTDVWKELQDNNAVFKEEIDRLWSLVNKLAGQPFGANKA